MKWVFCYEVYGHTDTTEGRGPMKVVARFSNIAAATEYVLSPYYAKWCVMGYQSKDDVNWIKANTIFIFDNFAELEISDKESIKEKALAKLTVIERKVLGL